jgi:hypothetical protein
MFGKGGRDQQAPVRVRICRVCDCLRRPVRRVIDPSIAIPLASDTAIQHCALIDSELIHRLALHTTKPATRQLDKLISITAINDVCCLG